MRTPRERYQNDPEFHQLVTMLESFIERAQYSPSELREAAVLASINYEMRRSRQTRYIDPQVLEAFHKLDKFTEQRTSGKRSDK